MNLAIRSKFWGSCYWNLNSQSTHLQMILHPSLHFLYTIIYLSVHCLIANLFFSSTDAGIWIIPKGSKGQMFWSDGVASAMQAANSGRWKKKQQDLPSNKQTMFVWTWDLYKRMSKTVTLNRGNDQNAAARIKLENSPCRLRIRQRDTTGMCLASLSHCVLHQWLFLEVNLINIRQLIRSKCGTIFLVVSRSFLQKGYPKIMGFNTNMF